MSAELAPNLDAFRAFLKRRVDEKKRVTAVTAVTSIKSNTCRLQTLVTRVTAGSTEDQERSEVLERQAFAEIDGHVPPVFSLAFAAFQMGCPRGYAVEEWRIAIDDAGRFLDDFGRKAASLGWQAGDIFGSSGLAWALRGASVSDLTPSMATLSDGRSFLRNE